MNKLTRKIWFDENSQPPKDYIWYKKGAFYQYIDREWKKVHDLVEDGNGDGYYTGDSVDEVENPKEGDIFVKPEKKIAVDLPATITQSSSSGSGSMSVTGGSQSATITLTLDESKTYYIEGGENFSDITSLEKQFTNVSGLPVRATIALSTIPLIISNTMQLIITVNQSVDVEKSYLNITEHEPIERYEYVDGEWQNRNELKAVQNRLTTVENELETKQVTTVKDKSTIFVYAQTLKNEGDIMYAPSKTTYLNKDNLTYTPPLTSSVCTINAYNAGYFLSNPQYTHIIIGTQFGSNKTPSYKIYQKTSYGDVYLLNLSTNEESVLSSNFQDPTKFSLSWNIMGTTVYIEDFTPDNASSSITSLLLSDYIQMSIEEDGVYYEKYRGKAIERPDLSVISSIENKQNVYSENISNISNPKEGDICNVPAQYTIINPTETSTGSYPNYVHNWDLSNWTNETVHIEFTPSSWFPSVTLTVTHSDNSTESISTFPANATDVTSISGPENVGMVPQVSFSIKTADAQIKEYYNGEWIDRKATEKQSVYNLSTDQIINPKEGDITIAPGHKGEQITYSYGNDINTFNYDKIIIELPEGVDTFNGSVNIYNERVDTIAVLNSETVFPFILDVSATNSISTSTFSIPAQTTVVNLYEYVSDQTKVYYNETWYNVKDLLNTLQNIPSILILNGAPNTNMTTLEELNAIGLTNQVIQDLANGKYYRVKFSNGSYSVTVGNCSYYIYNDFRINIGNYTISINNSSTVTVTDNSQ